MMTKDTFGSSSALLGSVLTGPVRREILDHTLTARSFETALKRLRSSMRSHSFKTGSGSIDLQRAVRALDARTRQDGFHVLHEWEQAAGRVSADEIPVLMLDHYSSLDVVTRGRRRELAILLDFYFLYLLALL